MKIFFDTEFTGLHKDTRLISIGLVDENGRTFYAETLSYREEDCNDWIKENVIANLKYNHVNDNWIDKSDKDNIVCKGYTYFLRQALEDWLSVYDEVQLVSDVCHYDMVLFIDIWGSAFDIPKQINAACHDINQDIAEFYNISEANAFDTSREQIVEIYMEPVEGDKHNSLYDAKVIKEIYNLIKSNEHKV